MDMRGYQQYKQQSINSMTSGELLLLLYDELVKRSTLASMALEKEDWPLFEGSVERCVDIISYLDETLDRQYPISQDLSRMYEYFTYQLGRIKIGRNKKELERLRPMLADMRDACRASIRRYSSCSWMPGMIAAFTLTAFAGDGGLIVELAGSTISRTYAIDSRSSAESWSQTASTMMPLTGMPRSTPMISLAWRLLM